MDNKDEVSYEQYRDALRLVEIYKGQIKKVYEEVCLLKPIDLQELSPNTRIRDCYFSVKTENLLRRWCDELGLDWNNGLLSSLSLLSYRDLIKYKGIGRSTVNEVSNVLHLAGLKLKQ